MSNIKVYKIEDIIEKELKMEVAGDMLLVIKVLSDKQVMYQYVSTVDERKDLPVLTKLEKTYDDIEEIEDYSFTNEFGGRYYLHQFE